MPHLKTSGGRRWRFSVGLIFILPLGLWRFLIDRNTQMSKKSRITRSVTRDGVLSHNEGKKKRDQYVNTVDEVERITGYDFFPALPDEIENEVESHASIDDWR